MKKHVVVSLAFAGAVLTAASVSEARRSMQDEVNLTCGTSYSCGLCHVDTKGGGPLTSGGAGYASAGNSACFFCPNDPDCGGGTTCTDSDHDGYATQGGTCGPVDCNDAVAAINPGACDILNDGIDQDCNGADRRKGKACR